MNRLIILILLLLAPAFLSAAHPAYPCPSIPCGILFITSGSMTFDAEGGPFAVAGPGFTSTGVIPVPPLIGPGPLDSRNPIRNGFGRCIGISAPMTATDRSWRSTHSCRTRDGALFAVAAHPRRLVLAHQAARRHEARLASRGRASRPHRNAGRVPADRNRQKRRLPPKGFASAAVPGWAISDSSATVIPDALGLGCRYRSTDPGLSA